MLGDGLITAEALRVAGMNAHAVDIMVRRGEFRRLRRGWYTLDSTWKAVGLDGRYRLFVRVTAAAAQRPLVLSHHSAAALHGLPLIGACPHRCMPLSLTLRTEVAALIRDRGTPNNKCRLL